MSVCAPPHAATEMMEIEHLFRSTARAVGLKPSAIEGEARLRRLERIISSKTIRPRLGKAKPACAGYPRQTFIRTHPSYPRRSVFSSGFQGKSRLRMHQTGSRGGAKAWGTVGAPLGHGMPCPDLQPETGASCASRATARRRRWGAVGGTAYRAPTCNRKPALRAPRAPRRGGAVRARHAVPRPAAGNRRLARYGRS